ncbi:MAG: hypothetical protein HeimC2_00380 [Candidatus Heimdallarchaeota archaeon LC_2]|nr:MAG: hypothetical protein HeimC2_00380 [Candidatus Heimdallarchaeota archaeon LC_2]
MGKKILIPLVILIIPFLSSSTFAETTTYSTSTLTSSGGSTYHLYMETDTLNWQLGKSYIFKVGIEVLSFAGDVHDFHDISLYVMFADASNFEISEISSGLGIISSVGQTYSYIWTVDIDETYPLSFSVFVGSLFREDISFAIDPETDDGWTKVADISTEIENFAPTIDTISNINYTEGEIGNTLTWTAHDENPASYTIMRDGQSISSGAWIDGAPITLSVDGLDSGTYIYIIEVSDEKGLKATDSVTVTVKSKPKKNDFPIPVLFDSLIFSFLSMGLIRKLLKRKP